MEALTPIPIDYTMLLRDGTTETCDLNGEVIVLSQGKVNTPSGVFYKVVAMRGEDEYGEYEVRSLDFTGIRMATYFAIKNIHKTFLRL